MQQAILRQGEVVVITLGQNRPKLDKSCLHLGVAVRAQKHALTNLGAKLLDAVRPTLRQPELLGTWVEMMKLQRGSATLIATQTAAPARLDDQDLLDLTSTAYDGFDATLPTSVGPPRVSNVLDRSMSGTHDDRLLASLDASLMRSRATRGPLGTMRTQTVLAEPVPHGRQAAPYRVRDLRQRCSLRDQRRQFLAAQPSPWPVLLAADGFEAVLLDPVANCRFVQIDSPSDLGERQSLVQKLLQRCPIHALHCLRPIGRKSEQVFVPARSYRRVAPSALPLPVSSRTRSFALSNSRFTSPRRSASLLTSPLSSPRARWI
jgi:hypothetical protein